MSEQWKVSPPPNGNRGNPWAVRDAATDEVVAIIPVSTSASSAEEVARQIVRDHKAADRLAAAERREERYRVALDNIRINADAFYATQTEMHPGHREILNMFGDAARAALSAPEQGEGEGGEQPR